MKIITDSTADLSAEDYEKHGIGVVPLTLRLGDRTWRDFFDIDPDAYYALLRESKDFPTTSQPSPEDFVDAFAPFVEKGEPILSIHISSKLSGTYQSAILARSHFPGARIEVVDSLQASLGLGMIVLLCAEKASRGNPIRGGRRLCPRSDGPGTNILLGRLPRISSSRGAYRQGASLPGDPYEDQAPLESDGRRDPTHRENTHVGEAAEQICRVGGKGRQRRKRASVFPWRSRTTATS